ncbi:hypothetical protein TrLO_g4771 [Triparma laevis f. longispina]|uniref:Vacuolar protein sorting-associated protein 29 n=1 Tax=Triparma laevis f. longispina TaxID=1714387 RepID=A0A9W7DVB5_9STRA|nr:hypothetical protein TrLO_g4771 [Triparma laevis f. longispina]
MAQFGELVLVIGDLHMPQRAADIPAKFKKMLVPNKMQHVLCTGNLTTRESHDMLRNLAPNVHIVRGDFDDQQNLPEQKTVQIGAFKIGLLHGHQVVPWGSLSALAMKARALDCDILISGHTHESAVTRKDGIWYINPGSVTGAYSPTGGGDVPSFILLAVQGEKVVCYCYKFNEAKDSVEVSKTEFSKGE